MTPTPPLTDPKTRLGTFWSLPIRLLFSFELNSSDDHASTYYEERMREGRVIKVQDVAFTTYVRLLVMHAAG